MRDKTNIVFILIDDIGWKDLACYGSEYYESSNIDRLSKEGIELIENRDKSKPFFLNLWHYAVHTPIQAKEEDIEYFF